MSFTVTLLIFIFISLAWFPLLVCIPVSKVSKSLCFNQVVLLPLLLLLLLWNGLRFYLQYLYLLKEIHFSFSPFYCKPSSYKFLPTCSLNFLKSASLKATVLILSSPSFPVDHKCFHFIVTLILISTIVFSAIYFQICRNLSPTLCWLLFTYMSRNCH